MLAFQSKLSEKEIEDLAAALTEQRNPRSENLEKMNARQLAELFVEEEKFVEDALRGTIADLAKAIEMVAESLRNRGRLFYVGAGSSGRIGVLDASEIPPTFGASPDLVQGIIAGGTTALYRSVEGAEDEESCRRTGNAGEGNKKRRYCHWDHRQRPHTFCPRRAWPRKVVRRKDDSADVQSGIVATGPWPVRATAGRAVATAYAIL